MIISTPLAALGFASLAVLTAIYCFRRLSPPKTVSSLLLWPAPRESTLRARRRERLRLPPIFFLEALALAALVCAALSPLVWRRSAGTLHVLLDVSPSMRADGGKAADEAVTALNAARRDGKDQVRVNRVATDLERALDTAVAVRAPGDEILVLTDRAPARPLPDGVRWRAFGAPLDNLAFTAARRTAKSPAEDALLLEVRRFGDANATTDVAFADGERPLFRRRLSFDADGRARLALSIPAATSNLVATLPNDALADDNRVTLAPPHRLALAVALSITNAPLKKLVERALVATAGVRAFTAPESADVIVTDRNRRDDGRAFTLRFMPDGAHRVSGPVWIDPGERATDSLTLSSAPFPVTDLPLAGRPIAFVGTRPLITLDTNAVRVAFSSPAHPFFRSSDFPILVENVLALADARTPRPAPHDANLLDPGESNLTSRCRIRLGSGAAVPPDARRTGSVAWIPALLALLALAVHAAIFRSRRTLVVLALVLLALVRPVLPRTARQGTLVVVADRSRSMSETALADQKKRLAALSTDRPDAARLAVVSYGARPVLEQPPAPVGFGDFVQAPDPDGSDLAAALERVRTLLDDGSPARLLVLSDGLFTGAAATEGFSRALLGTVPIDTLLQTRTFAHDVSIARINAPSTVTPKSAVSVAAWVQATECSTNAYALLHGTNVIARGRRVFREGLTPLVFRDTAGSAGVRHYALVVAPTANDPEPGNNRAEFLVKVEGRRPLLLVDGTGGSPTADALRRAGIDVHVRRGDGFSAALDELAGYGGVLLENVPAKGLSSATLRNLAAYVTDLGGGLALTGGERSFGPGGWYKTPVEDVLPVTLELRQEHRKYALALAIVLDRSGSMAAVLDDGRTKMDMANLGATGAIDMLTALDEVTVIAVDSTPHTVLDLQSGDRAQINRNRVLGIKSEGGGIFVEQGILAALRNLEKSKNAIRHIILFADAADAEEPGDYRKYLAKAAALGISVSVIGLGSESDCDAALLKDIAAVGRGECWFERNATEIPRLFMQDTFLAAKTAMCTNQTPVKTVAGLRQLSDTLPAALPAVGGYNLTYLRDDAEPAILTADDEQAPLLAFTRRGLGRTLAFTGELSGPRAAPLMTSPAGAELASAIARWTLGDDAALTHGFLLDRRPVPGGLVVEAVADVDDPLSAVPGVGLPLTVVRESPDRGLIRESFTLEWDGADALSAFVPLSGNETVIPVVHFPNGANEMLPPFRLPYPAECARPADPQRGRRALEQISAKSGGKVLSTTEGLWDSLPPVPRALALAPGIYLLAAVLFLAFVFQRRLGWEFKGLTRLLRRHPANAVPRRKADDNPKSASADAAKNPPSGPHETPPVNTTLAALERLRKN